MATTRQLENQIRKLQNQLEESDRNLRNIQHEISRVNTNQYESLRREYDRLLEQKTKQNAQKYEQSLQHLREEMAMLEIQRGKEIRDAIEMARNEQRVLLEQLEEKNRELLKIVEEAKARELQQIQGASSFSERMICEAEGAKKRVLQLPHEFFFPRQFSIIQEHLTRATELAGRRMYEAAAATADAARVEIELLSVKTIQKITEWKELFDLYCDVVKRLHERLDLLLNIRLQTEAGIFSMNQEEIDFWSQGYFSPLRNKISDAYRTVEEIEEIGIDKYLKRQPPMTLFKLNKTLSEAEELEIRMEAVERCVRNERIFSDARFMAGQRIIDLLEEYGYANPEEAGFLKKNGREDPGDCYEIRYRVGKTDELKISIIPVRRDGVCTGNRVLVKWTIKSVPDPEIIEGASETIKARIATELGEEQIQIVSRETDEKIRATVEAMRRCPDPNLLFEKLRS